MYAILEKLLKKRNIESVDKLTPDERETFARYEYILSKPDVTIDDFKQFIIARIAQIEMRWQDYNLAAEKKAELIPYHTTYKILLACITAPILERQALEQSLLAQLD